MSNTIPDGLDDVDARPYCIWNPDFASPETYRDFARQYPARRCHVGRACAAAGYTELYAELGLLLDISIAEEARKSKRNNRAIFESITRNPVKYEIMDDYTCTFNTQNPEVPGIFEQRYLLFNPLPQDLPTVDKHVLILVAALESNVNRYARLTFKQGMGNTENISPTQFALETLAERCSGMKEAAGIACIVCDYEYTYRKINPEPSYLLWTTAKNSTNPYYREDVEKRGAEQGLNLENYRGWDGELDNVEKDMEPTPGMAGWWKQHQIRHGSIG
ncbi:hypothetical protein QQZ08_010084 [Neonectria magnoliae]|uniref:Uncharacterized protein n=1 Tax=Neonectria magnoliae TaxID=2732573 RepID=A0ABR1HJJ3_9HYPO